MLTSNRIAGVVMVVVLVVGCAPRKKPVTTAPPEPAATTARTEPEAPRTTPPPPPERLEDRQPVAPAITEDPVGSRSIDDLNRDSPLKPTFFVVDSAELDDAGRAVATANADVLKKYGSWVVTIEGHADERGTAEYNLALGERRALAVKTYLVSLGIAPDRLRTVSYGKEFPFDPGHDEAAWAKNRRAHFVITAK
jgi:peptidoglycan-associated lipoprotein